MATTYGWVGSPNGGDWNNPNNWFSLTIESNGVPGPGDTALVGGLASETITVDGVTVENVSAGFSKIVGDITITGTLDGGTLVGGTDTVGTDYGAVFEGKQLTAGVINGNAMLKSGMVQTTWLADSTIGGANVTADKGIARSTAGPMGLGPLPCTVLITAGSLTDDGTMTLAAGAAGPDSLTIEPIKGAKAMATIEGAATCNGSGVEVVSGGGQLVIADLTLSDGAALVDGTEMSGHLTGGAIMITALDVGKTGTGLVDLTAGTLKVTDCVLGSGSGVVAGPNGGGTGGTGGFIITGGADFNDEGDFTAVAGSTVVASGGAITVNGKTIIGAAALPGSTPAIARAIFQNKGEKATFTGPVIVGDKATGMVTIANGAIVDGTATWTFGDSKNGPGTVTVTGSGSTLSTTTSITVGSGGKGTLEVSGQGKVTAETMSVAAGSSVTVDGRGTGIDLSGGISANPNEVNGSLSVTGGAAVSVLDGTVIDYGTITVSGKASALRVHDLHVNGSLTVSGGAEVGVSDELDVHANLKLTGGTIAVGAGPAAGPGFVSVSKGGVLRLDPVSYQARLGP